jgi:hypothetical protein
MHTQILGQGDIDLAHFRHNGPTFCKADRTWQADRGIKNRYRAEMEASWLAKMPMRFKSGK